MIPASPPFLEKINDDICIEKDRLCGLVVRVPGYRSRAPGSIPGSTRFPAKLWVWNRVNSALKSYLKEK
jgi:hypothetical protein